VSQNSADRKLIEKQIVDVIVTDGMLDRSLVTSDATLESLGVHSVDVMMILMSIEEKFGVYLPIDGKIAESKNLSEFVESLADRIIHEQKSRAK